MSDTVGDRVRAIREGRGEKQPEFAAAMNGAAKRLGISERYDNTKVSKMELGTRDVSLADVMVIADLDHEKRGRDWLAWGTPPKRPAMPDPQRDRRLSEQEELRALRQDAADERETSRTAKTAPRRKPKQA